MQYVQTEFSVSTVSMIWGFSVLSLWESLKDNVQNCNHENLSIKYNR